MSEIFIEMHFLYEEGVHPFGMFDINVAPEELPANRNGVYAHLYAHLLVLVAARAPLFRAPSSGGGASNGRRHLLRWPRSRGRWCGLWRGSEARGGASTFKWYLVSAAHALRCSLFHLEVGSAGEKGEVVCVEERFHANRYRVSI